ncbi:MAG: hypothetical protein V4760_11375, partial [Bdellovibrionota bacterium]
TGSAARKRSVRLADSGTSLMALDPCRRTVPTNFASSIDAMAIQELGARVAELLEEKAESSQTQILSDRMPARNRPWMKPIAASLLAVVSTLSISVRAEAPLEIESERSRLEVRTNRWVELEINGHPAGFSPISIHGLRPGLHRIKWSGAGGTGETRVELFAGRTLKLNEADLARISVAVKR